MSGKYCIFSDLDRTLLPNGEQPESPSARPLFRALAQRPDVFLCYVSGRDRDLLQQAIDKYDLPMPDFAIGDVGTSIYRINDEDWLLWQPWHDAIAADWAGIARQQLADRLADLASLTAQEPAKQGRFKLSYYVPLDVSPTALLDEVDRRLTALGVRTSLIWSIDEQAGIGLLDILPASADKLQAIRFMRARLQLTTERLVFAGDSGNDLAVLTSEIRSILVANAHPDVVAVISKQQGGSDDGTLYHARGGYLGMNGCYAAGVLEGVGRYFPALDSWLTEKLRSGAGQR